jgi:hypothetical protein
MTNKTGPDFVVILGGGELPPHRVGEVEWKFLHPRMTREMLGYIPIWLSYDDPRSARAQINAGYTMGGWNDFEGFRLGKDNSLHYPGDPAIKPLAEAQLRDELIVFYPHSWVAIIQPDRTFRVARID